MVLIGLSLIILIAVALAIFGGRQSESYVYEIVTTLVIWNLALELGDVSSPIAFMSVYSEAQRREYYEVMRLFLVFLFLYHVTVYFAVGGTLAKRLAGLRVVRADGAALGLRDALRRAMVIFGLWLLILAPGPIVGFAFGPGSEAASVGLLFAALIVCLFLSTEKASEPGRWYQSRLDHLLGLKCLHARRLLSFRGPPSA